MTVNYITCCTIIALTWVSTRVEHSRKTPHPGLDLGNGDLRNFAGRGSAQPEWTKVFWAEGTESESSGGKREQASSGNLSRPVWLEGRTRRDLSGASEERKMVMDMSTVVRRWTLSTAIESPWNTLRRERTRWHLEGAPWRWWGVRTEDGCA